MNYFTHVEDTAYVLEVTENVADLYTIDKDPDKKMTSRFVAAQNDIRNYLFIKNKLKSINAAGKIADVKTTKELISRFNSPIWSNLVPPNAVSTPLAEEDINEIDIIVIQTLIKAFKLFKPVITLLTNGDQKLFQVKDINSTYVVDISKLNIVDEYIEDEEVPTYLSLVNPPCNKLCRPYQKEAIIAALNAYELVGVKPILSPTGSGKTFMAYKIIKMLKDMIDITYHIVAPSINILEGFAREFGISTNGLSPAKAKLHLESHGLYTYGRYYNLLIVGEIQPPKVLVIDEVHHLSKNSKVIGYIFKYLALTTFIYGFTATYRRGTAKGSVDLFDMAGDPIVASSVEELMQLGYLSKINCEIFGLIDDEGLYSSNGQIMESAVNNKYGIAEHTVYKTISELIKKSIAENGVQERIIFFNTKEQCRIMKDRLDFEQIPCDIILAETTAKERAEIIARHENGSVIINISVMAEGVDRPELKELYWASCHSLQAGSVIAQQIAGRLFRKNKDESEKTLYCFNRNLEYFGVQIFGKSYFDSHVYQKAVDAFPMANAAIARRNLGLESMGKRVERFITLSDGNNDIDLGYYEFSKIVSDTNGIRKRMDYILCMKPDRSVLCMSNECSIKFTGEYTDDGFAINEYSNSRWKIAEPLEDGFVGYHTKKKRGGISEKQLKELQRNQKTLKISPNWNVTRDNIQIMFALRDTKESLI